MEYTDTQVKDYILEWECARVCQLEESFVDFLICLSALMGLYCWILHGMWAY